MFLLRLWRWLRGWVRFEAEGGAVGRLLSLAAREHLPLWDTHREGVVLSARCLAADYHRLRPLARRCGLRMRLKERHGAVFILRRYHARPGLAAGMAVYAILLILLSGRIWAVDVRGVSTADEAALRALLQEQGVAVGEKKAGVHPDDIQLAAIQQLEDISWLAVNLDGCVAQIEVKEVNTDEAPQPTDAPSNLVATRDGVIVEMEITGGEAAVKVGDAVTRDFLLASGITATERGTLFRRSQGVVMAQTSHQIIVRVPLNESLLLPVGQPHETLELRLFGLLLPLSDDGARTDNCQIEEFDRLLTLGGVDLPLGVRMRRYTPLAAQPVSRTAEQAELLARERLAQEEATTLTDMQIVDRTISAAIKADTLILTADYRCVENIAREIPLQMENPAPPV